MEIIIQPNAEAASLIAARLVARSRPRQARKPCWSLATGSTPLAMYRELARLHREEGLDFSGVTTFNLDEYVGLPAEHPASYHAFMRDHFFRRSTCAARQYSHIPDGLAPDIPVFCQGYEEAIRSRRMAASTYKCSASAAMDMASASTEPSSSLASRTRIKTLTAQTRRDQRAAAFGSPRIRCRFTSSPWASAPSWMPVRCSSWPLARKERSRRVAAAVEGPITAMNPAIDLANASGHEMPHRRSRGRPPEIMRNRIITAGSTIGNPPGRKCRPSRLGHFEQPPNGKTSLAIEVADHAQAFQRQFRLDF